MARAQDATDDLHAFPWRICLAGGWLDQPWVSKLHPGPVIVVNVRPHDAFKTRSGLATSTRALGIELWGCKLGGRPPRHMAPERLARLLFNVENPVDCAYVSGSQDHLGLLLPGVSRLDYDGHRWPSAVHRLGNTASAEWLERVLWLVPLPSRPPEYDPLLRKNVTTTGVRRLADASERAWRAIKATDCVELGAALTLTMSAWQELLPETVPDGSDALCTPYKQHHGCLFSGAGGGFLLVIADEGDTVEGGFQVEITRTDEDLFSDGHGHGVPLSPGLRTPRSPSERFGQRNRGVVSDLLGQLLMAMCVGMSVGVLCLSIAAGSG